MGTRPSLYLYLSRGASSSRTYSPGAHRGRTEQASRPEPNTISMNTNHALPPCCRNTLSLSGSYTTCFVTCRPTRNRIHAIVAAAGRDHKSVLFNNRGSPRRIATAIPMESPLTSSTAKRNPITRTGAANLPGTKHISNFSVSQIGEAAVVPTDGEDSHFDSTVFRHSLRATKCLCCSPGETNAS